MIQARDAFGNPLTLQHEASAAVMTGFVDRFVGYRPSILAVLGAAESDDSLGACRTWGSSAAKRPQRSIFHRLFVP